MNRLDPRVERAWGRLENWARTWYRPDAPGYFAWTLGGTSLTQIFFGNVAADSVVKLLMPLDVQFLLAKRGNGPNEASTLVSRDISDFMANTRDDSDEGCFVLARAKVLLEGGIFECQILVERQSGVTSELEVLITWVPLLEFLNTRELKHRFSDIFGWFFSVQQILQSQKILLCLEHCPHPRTDSSAWTEI